MKDLSEANVTTYHYEYDPNGNRTQVEIKDDGLTPESTVYTYDRLNKLVSSREVTASGLYFYERNNGDGPHYFFNKKNTIYAKMLICQDIVELNQKQIYIMQKNRDELKYILHKKDIKGA